MLCFLSNAKIMPYYLGQIEIFDVCTSIHNKDPAFDLFWIYRSSKIVYFCVRGVDRRCLVRNCIFLNIMFAQLCLQRNYFIT